MIHRKDTFTVYFLNSDTQKTFPSLEEAKKAAEHYVGNNRYSKLFPNEEAYAYGPGDGTTSVFVRQDIEFIPEAKSETEAGN